MILRFRPSYCVRAICLMLILTIIIIKCVLPALSAVLAHLNVGPKNESVLLINNNQQLHIAIYYETLCPDSKFFILNHATPLKVAFDKYVHIDLIPYGKAQTFNTQNGLRFACQHGPAECYFNKLHSCIIASMDDNLLLMQFIECTFKLNNEPTQTLHKCTSSFIDRMFDFKLNVTSVLECANTEQGALLLQQHGIKTDSVRSPLTFVPTIAINGNSSANLQPELLRDLQAVACRYLDDMKLYHCS